MPKGKCIAKISNTEHNVFYSDIYDLKKHPRYKTLFEPRDPKTINNLYDHRKYLEANHKKVIKKKKFEEMGINAEIVTIASNSIDPVDLASIKSQKDYPDAAPGSKRLMQKLQDFEEDNRLKLEQYL